MGTLKRSSLVVAAIGVFALAPSHASGAFGFLEQFGKAGNGPDEFDYPEAIAFSETELLPFIADTSNHKIKTYDAGIIFQYGTRGSDPGELRSPWGVAPRESTPDVYVADSFNDRIQVFEYTTGQFVDLWGTTGTGAGQFNFPQGLAFDSAGNLIVVDSGNSRIQVFEPDGDFVRQWGSAGSGTGQFDNPGEVAVDSLGNIYVSDTNNNRIQKFDPDGDFLDEWGTQGSGAGELKHPRGVAINSADEVFVADRGNNRIQAFDSSGNFLFQGGGRGEFYEKGAFFGLTGMAFNSSDELYVINSPYSKIRVFGEGGKDVFSPETVLDDSTIDKEGGTASFTFSGYDDVTEEADVRFQCKLTGEARRFRKCSSPKDYSKLDSGKYSMRIQAVDDEGNIDRSPLAVPFKIKR